MARRRRGDNAFTPVHVSEGDHGMPRFLLCWEFGGGLGHAGRFQPLTQELLRRGHEVDLVLREVVHTRSLLRDLGVRTLQAPMWMHQTVGVPNPTISLTEILMGNGYLRAETLAALVAGWQSLMDLCRPDVVVADYAPTATIAARIMGIPVATVGIGFYLPPDAPTLPPFRTWEPIPSGRVEHYDRTVRDTVNQVLTEQGAKPIGRLSDIFRGELPLLCTWPELDHYQRGALPEGQRYHGPTFLPSGGAAPEWPTGRNAGDGPPVFAYLRGSHPDHLAVLQALDQAGCRTLCYMPEVTAGKPPPLDSPRICYSKGPVHMAQTLPQSRLVICHGGEATLAQAVLAGVPVMLLPMQAEQFLMSQRVAASGAGINVAARPRPTPFGEILDTLLNKPDHARHAQALASRYASFDHDAQTVELVDAFESLLPAGIVSGPDQA
jgi:UDP:flavonoid glycosyltransferase YjiC (YdhE family)